MDEDSRLLLQLLLTRLERISADSPLAHQASGVRGSLLRLADLNESRSPRADSRRIALMELGFSILRNAFEERSR
jgi:hypothetical protein